MNLVNPGTRAREPARTRDPGYSCTLLYYPSTPGRTEAWEVPGVAIATLDALEVDLSSHLRERKRIIQNVAGLEHRSGERPAVIATLTWGGTRKVS